jgi:hypothetical protein
MTKIVTGGVIRRTVEAAKMAVEVEIITFPHLPQAPVPPPGSPAVLTVRRVPHTPYVVGEPLLYEDGNNNNARNFVVTSVVGPAKYNVI